MQEVSRQYLFEFISSISDFKNSKEALRSIVISQQLLGTREIALFHHTDCGMLTFKNEDLQKSLKEKYPSATQEIESIDFYPFGQLEQSVKDDVSYLKQHPLVLDESTITGWIFDVKTGKVSEKKNANARVSLTALSTFRFLRSCKELVVLLKFMYFTSRTSKAPR